MKPAASSVQCDSTTGSSKFVDLLSSVNSLIGTLSDGSEQQQQQPPQQPQQPQPAPTVGAIDSQLRQLERLFAAAPSAGRRRTAKRRSGGGGGGGGGSGGGGRRRPWCRSKTAAAAAAVTADGGCSRSPCSNCNSAAAAGASVAAELLSVSSETEQQHHRQYRHHQLSVKQSSRLQVSGGHPQFFAANASNRRRAQQRYVVTKRRGTPSSNDGSSSAGPRGGGKTRAANSARDTGAVAPEPPMNFGYLKRGLADGGGGGGGSGGRPVLDERGCADTVVNMERLVQNLQSHVAQLILQCQQHQDLQRQRRLQNCGLPERLTSEVRRAQARVAALRSRLQRVASTSGGAGRGGCRHVGVASEQARDPLSDLRCKYERSLLYSRFDVKWPFLNIIAPRQPDFGQPPCCDEEYYG